MPDARWPSSIPLLAAALLATSLQGPLACDAEQPEQPAATGELTDPLPLSSLPQCAPYIGDASIYGFCLSKHAGGLPTLKDMLEVCLKAGEWERDCRHGWVSGRMNAVDQFSMEELLEACGQNPDCTFELLDFRPAEDPLTQLNLCSLYAGQYGRDCAGHAIQRWWLTDPGEEELLRVTSTPTPYPDKVGYWIGVNVQCFSKGTCAGDPHFAHNCEKAVENFARNPDLCPARTKTPMHSDSRSQDLAPFRPDAIPTGPAKSPGSPPIHPGHGGQAHGGQ